MRVRCARLARGAGVAANSPPTRPPPHQTRLSLPDLGIGVGLQQLLGQGDRDDAGGAAHAAERVGDDVTPHLEMVYHHGGQGRRRVEQGAVDDDGVHVLGGDARFCQGRLDARKHDHLGLGARRCQRRGGGGHVHGCRPRGKGGGVGGCGRGCGSGPGPVVPRDRPTAQPWRGPLHHHTPPKTYHPFIHPTVWQVGVVPKAALPHHLFLKLERPCVKRAAVTRQLKKLLARHPQPGERGWGWGGLWEGVVALPAGRAALRTRPPARTPPPGIQPFRTGRADGSSGRTKGRRAGSAGGPGPARRPAGPGRQQRRPWPARAVGRGGVGVGVGRGA